MEKNTDFKLNYCHVFLGKSTEKFTATGPKSTKLLLMNFTGEENLTRVSFLIDTGFIR